jgi:hypothetical protein
MNSTIAESNRPGRWWTPMPNSSASWNRWRRNTTPSSKLSLMPSGSYLSVEKLICGARLCAQHQPQVLAQGHHAFAGRAQPIPTIPFSPRCDAQSHTPFEVAICDLKKVVTICDRLSSVRSGIFVANVSNKIPNPVGAAYAAPDGA